jgi:hypothetical protein
LLAQVTGKDIFVERDSPNASQVGGIAEGHAGVELSGRRHVARGRGEIEHIQIVVKYHATIGGACEGQRMAVASCEGMVAGLGTGMEIGGYKC